MKCIIEINGDLKIEPENESEAFCLQHWKGMFDGGHVCVKLYIKPSGAPWDAKENILTVNKYIGHKK